LSVVGFGNGIVKLVFVDGSVANPVSKTSTWPGKGGTKTPDGRVIVKVKAALPVPMTLVALMVTLKVPTPVGVPEINPVVGSTDNPPGNPSAS